MDHRADLEITVVDYPAKHLIGIRSRTTIPRASIDCPEVWKKFSARLKELPGKTRNKTYGLYVMVDRRISFDHWAAVEVPRETPIPKGMEVFELPGKKYACCFVLNAASMLLAYNAVYSIWVQGQDEYDVDMNGPCFELYPPKWKSSDAFHLYVPLIPIR